MGNTLLALVCWDFFNISEFLKQKKTFYMAQMRHHTSHIFSKNVSLQEKSSVKLQQCQIMAIRCLALHNELEVQSSCEVQESFAVSVCVKRLWRYGNCSQANVLEKTLLCVPSSLLFRSPAMWDISYIRIRLTQSRSAVIVGCN